MREKLFDFSDDKFYIMITAKKHSNGLLYISHYVELKESEENRKLELTEKQLLELGIFKLVEDFKKYIRHKLKQW